MDREIRDFTFFDYQDKTLFHRSDAETATWTQHEYTIKAVFPFSAEKNITRGMRIGFFDFDNVFQCFEIRQVKTLEPDHSQQITAEHICVSELTDVHFFLYQPEQEVTASAAINAVMNNCGWTVGTIATAVATAEPDLLMTSVWSALCTLRDLFGFRIEPVVTVMDNGITGRKLNFASPDGVWRGVRLSLNKNAAQIGVTIDDTNLITAIYGYGESTSQADQTPEYLTFANAVWTKTADHPAKPAGQAYLEDPDATALYGRNGRARFGFYSNTAVKDAEKLLELSWEALKQGSKPTVTVDLKIADLQRLGYGGQDIRLGDKVVIDIEPTGEQITDVVNTLDVDLLNPLETRPGVGAFIPDIVYINHDTANGQTASIGGGGGGGGGRKAKQNKDVWTTFQRTDEYIQMTANRVTRVDNTVTTQGTKIDINSERILMTASATEWDTIKQKGVTLYSSITQNASKIELKVSKGDVSTQLAVECGNVTVSGGNLIVEGMVTAETVKAALAQADVITSGEISAFSVEATTGVSGGTVTGTTVNATSTFNFSGETAEWKSQYVLTGLGTLRSFTYSGVTLRAFNGTGTTASGTTIYYLGHT